MYKHTNYWNYIETDSVHKPADVLGPVLVLWGFQFLLLHSFFFHRIILCYFKIIKNLKIFVSKTNLRWSVASNNILHILS